MKTIPSARVTRRHLPAPFSLSLSINLLPALFFSALLPLSAQDTPPPPAAGSEGYAPPEYGIDRYEKLRGKSPFEFELAKPVLAPDADPFADLVLAGFAGSGGNVTVYLVNTKTQERITVLGDGSKHKNESGFRALGIKRGRTLASTTALVEKDGVPKELAFDPKALSSMSGGAGGGAAPGAPGARPGQPGAPGQQGAPGQGLVRPNNVPGRPVQAYQAPQAFVPGQGNRALAQPAAMAAGQPGGQPGVQTGLQLANPAGAAGAQQQINTLINPNTGLVAPTPNAINPGGAQPPQPSNQPPRRRVVLPTNNP